MGCERCSHTLKLVGFWGTDPDPTGGATTNLSPPSWLAHTFGARLFSFQFNIYGSFQCDIPKSIFYTLPITLFPKCPSPLKENLAMPLIKSLGCMKITTHTNEGSSPASVCLFISHNSEVDNLRMYKFGIRDDLDSWHILEDVIFFRSKGQRSRSQSQFNIFGHMQDTFWDFSNLAYKNGTG